ncbi:hypothetical protein HII36_37680, partial [Nonomuraea sp. NN258]|nr:hypothetical protein [Nonomuraea antri]
DALGGQVNARIRWVVKARGHFPNEQAALKCAFMAITSLDPTGKGRERWIARRKAALNASPSPSKAVRPRPSAKQLRSLDSPSLSGADLSVGLGRMSS